MGDIKRKKRHYSTPRKRWDKERIAEEKKTKEIYGLKNKRELWRTQTMLRKKRKDARELLVLDLEKRVRREQELIGSIAKYGILDDKATLDDVLSLPVESFLERRLQTIVWRKGLAGTVSQARQFITHGHISVNGKKISVPGYLVKKDEENKMGYYGKPMEIQEKKQREIRKAEPDAKKKLEKDFEESKPETEKNSAENKEAEKTAEEVAEKKGEKAEEKKSAVKEKKEAAGKEDKIEEKKAEAQKEKKGEKK